MKKPQNMEAVRNAKHPHIFCYQITGGTVFLPPKNDKDAVLRHFGGELQRLLDITLSSMDGTTYEDRLDYIAQTIKWDMIHLLDYIPDEEDE